MNYNVVTEMVETGLISKHEGEVLYPIVSGCKFIPGQVKKEFENSTTKKYYKMDLVGRGIGASISAHPDEEFKHEFSYHTVAYDVESNGQMNSNSFGRIMYGGSNVCSPVKSEEITQTADGFYIRSVQYEPGQEISQAKGTIKFYDKEALSTYCRENKDMPSFDAEEKFKRIGIIPDIECEIVYDPSKGVQDFIGNISNKPKYNEELCSLVGLELEDKRNISM